MTNNVLKIIAVIFLTFGITACGDNSGSSVLFNPDENTGGGTSYSVLNNNPATKNAHRLLLQASFGPTQQDLERVLDLGIESWIEQQLNSSSAYNAPEDEHLNHLQRTIQIAQTAEPNHGWYNTPIFNQSGSASALQYQMAAWWENALGLHPIKTAHGKDQLRQRMAYALSQILVAAPGEFPLLKQRGEAQAYYYDLMARHAFGNFRQLLEEVTKSPAMGMYLSHQGNRKADPAKGTRPDENFAREIMQLFTIGLYELNLDGSPNRDGNPNTYPDPGDNYVNAYSQTDVEELAKVMTGWDFQENPGFGTSDIMHGNLVRPMEFTPAQHEDELAEGGDGYVTLLGKTFALNAGPDGSGLQPALDFLFNHPNTGPFICKQLIMRLVTSNPSPDYIARIARVFNDNGQGIRGDLKAVTRAMLLDEEARSTQYANQQNYGKIKEPLLAWTQLLRMFNAAPLDGWKSQSNHQVAGVYWHPSPNRQIQQAALRSPSVFNFYSPDFVPSDEYFSSRQLVSPELQITTEHMLLAYSNMVHRLVNDLEKNSILRVKNRSLGDYASRQNHTQGLIMLIDFDRELALFGEALDGNNRGNFSRMDERNSQGIPYKQLALAALLDHLDVLMLGGRMTPEYRAGLIEYLMNGSDLNHNNNFREALGLIQNAVRMIATSSAYMLQK